MVSSAEPAASFLPQCATGTSLSLAQMAAGHRCFLQSFQEKQVYPFQEEPGVPGTVRRVLTGPRQRQRKLLTHVSHKPPELVGTLSGQLGSQAAMGFCDLLALQRIGTYFMPNALQALPCCSHLANRF